MIVKITSKGRTEKYEIKKNNDGLLSLFNMKDSKEWGIFGKTHEDIIELLKQDKEEGYCDSFEVIES